MNRSDNQEAKAVWDANADFWDQRMGEGNDFHRSLIEPTQLRLLDIAERQRVGQFAGGRVLDLACGNGQFARKLASLGATVVAADGSAEMIEHAKRRTGPDTEIEYRVVDCTDENELETLGGGFDAAVCTMALMDIADVRAIAAALVRLVKAEGPFVFSVLHPCFNSGFSRYGIERFDRDTEVVTECYVRAMKYDTPVTVKGIAMEGQPHAQFYFHRPLHELLRPFFHAGFLLSGLEEPVFPARSDAGVYQQVYSQIPAALVVRLCRCGA